MAKTKNKTLAPAAGKNKQIISRTNPVSSAKPVSRARSAQAHLQRVYQENGFIGSPDHRRIDFPVSRYRNHPGLIISLIILIIA